MTVETTTAGPPRITRFMLSLTRGLNLLLATILRSPLHGRLSNRFMLLSFQGRKSGKNYTVVVGYTRVDDELEVISPRGWWKNLRGKNTAVRVLLQGKWSDGVAEAFHDDEVVVDGYLRAIQKSPALIGMYRIELDGNGQPKRESVRQATRNCALIRIRLTA